MAQLKKNTSSYGGSLVRCVTACSSKPCPLSNSFEGRQHHSTSPCILEDTSRFRYTFRNGQPLAIRVAHMVRETVALNHMNVRWYVFGDDDTVFFPHNLAKTFAKYNHQLWYYIGAGSEIYQQNKDFGFKMAFGGAGFAISYPLAKVLAKVFDSCIERCPHLWKGFQDLHLLGRARCWLNKRARLSSGNID
ncbi:hypothetical protein V6N13_046744 [Hibiscus sabdariffa]|uniref:Uncharacterized protein n=1 Tax=Hibiscus sabdariffa TaxID=183260 RepID=A0ABR2B733_9ROSI